MEPSGRNPWQPVANGGTRKRLKQAKTVAVGCDQLPIGAHGKEGVDGSSPSEGSSQRKIPGNRGFMLSKQHHGAPPHYRRDGYSARRAAAKPLQIDLLPGTSEHLPKREGVGSRAARRGPPRTAWTSVMWRGLAREVRVGDRRTRGARNHISDEGPGPWHDQGEDRKCGEAARPRMDWLRARDLRDPRLAA